MMSRLVCILYFSFGALFHLSAQSNESVAVEEIAVMEQFENFESKHLNSISNDTIMVYNFWATWCKPCIQELPYFDSLNQYQGKPVIQLVLVSLDFEAQIETKLKPFIKANNISNEVIVLTDGKVNTWINQVDSSWSGAIPATLVIKGNEKLFYEQSFHSYNELLTAILKIND